MSEHGTITKSGRYPPQTFLVTDRKLSCDVTDLINDGAKLNVVIDRVRDEWNAPVPRGKKNDWVYYAVYHAVDRWVAAGIAEKLSKYLHSLYPGLTQKRGVFVRAKTTTNPKTPRLINDLQNSKCFAERQKRPRLDRHTKKTKPCSTQIAEEHADLLTAAELHHPLDRYNSIPGRCGFWRMQAIRVAKSINRYELFIRDKNGNLPAQLQQLIHRQQLMFNEWKKETENKSIILRKLTGEQEYIKIPCSTRFTDDSRKKQLILAYNTGVENSLKKHTFATFITFTTDPLIWLSEEGKEILRKIPDPHVDHVHRFDATGRGGSSYTANRHESTAFRKWYETECHRAGFRIPYLRCVEFQENGLIHDHIMLFDYSWNYSFPEFARQWGTKYGQGFMHDVYHVINENGEKWTWKTDKPADTDGRNPTDYLKKYLIKALYDETGHYAYWVTNKRFFTMSKSLRYLTIQDEIKQKAFIWEHAATDHYEFVGTAPKGHEESRIDEDLRRRAGLKPAPRVQRDNRNICEDYHEINLENIAPQIWYVPPPLDDTENPDQEIEITAVIPAEPDRTAYDQQLAEEARLREERRARLKQRSG